ncbi:MAG: hypothetical protein KAG93_01830 [Desulfuromusa sp.]|nr:hypothetical protein [Desulfuromusa sp.]
MKFFRCLVLLVCLSGCGYHFSGHSGRLPGGVETLYIPLFVNKTNEPRLETRFASQVSEVFSRNNEIRQVEKQKDADAILLGTVRNYKNKSLSYDRGDDIGSYYSTMDIDVELRQVDTNQLLWEGSLRWKEVYRASSDKNIQDLSRQRALQQIVLRLSEELLSRLLDDF